MECERPARQLDRRHATSAIPDARFTHAEYVALEQASARKHELVGGRILAVAGARPRHNAVAQRMANLLDRALSDRCITTTSDQRVFVETTELSAYPDVTVVCGEWRMADGDALAVCNPSVLVEVLSRSTAANDRGVKAPEYREIPELRDLLLVSADRAHVEHWRRQEDGRWLVEDVVGADGVVRVSLGVELRLGEVYAGLDRLPPDDG